MHSADPDSVGLVVGLDIGGTSSRVVVGDLSGETVGTGQAGGGNPNSRPPQQAAEQVARATRTALAGLDPGRVRGGVLGMAGVSKMADAAVAGLFEGVWTALGLTCPMRVVSDCEVAFAAGTSRPGGTVLIAGTGAIAARVTGHRLTAVSGGYGWLLGDEGSAFWLGREAVRETLRALDEWALDGLAPDRPLDPLVESVFTGLLGPPGLSPGRPAEDRRRLITAVNADEPVRLAELAPLVTACARSDSATALAVVRRAASLLAETVQAIRPSGDTTPTVLGGSLLAADNPVREALDAELGDRDAGERYTAGSGAAGAAWLAALDLIDSPALDDPRAQWLHQRYLSASGT